MLKGLQTQIDNSCVIAPIITGNGVILGRKTLLSNGNKAYLPGTTVYVKCHKNYEVDGPNDAVCEDGKFSTRKFTCRKSKKFK